MDNDSTTTAIKTLDRINLRLSPETFGAIDACCSARVGHVSRNTWLTEAVEEKLLRDRAECAQNEGLRRNG